MKKKQGAGQDRLGIYIKSVVAGGAADAVSKSKKSLKFIFLIIHFLCRMGDWLLVISFSKLMGRV